MKKNLILIVLLIFVFCLVSCGENKNDNLNNKEDVSDTDQVVDDSIKDDESDDKPEDDNSNDNDKPTEEENIEVVLQQYSNEVTKEVFDSQISDKFYAEDWIEPQSLKDFILFAYDSEVRNSKYNYEGCSPDSFVERITKSELETDIDNKIVNNSNYKKTLEFDVESIFESDSQAQVIDDIFINADLNNKMYITSSNGFDDEVYSAFTYKAEYILIQIQKEYQDFQDVKDIMLEHSIKYFIDNNTYTLEIYKYDLTEAEYSLGFDVFQSEKFVLQVSFIENGYKVYMHRDFDYYSEDKVKYLVTNDIDSTFYLKIKDISLTAVDISDFTLMG